VQYWPQIGSLIVNIQHDPSSSQQYLARIAALVLSWMMQLSC
jgi:hypothetical protein